MFYLSFIIILILAIVNLALGLENKNLFNIFVSGWCFSYNFFSLLNYLDDIKIL